MAISAAEPLMAASADKPKPLSRDSFSAFVPVTTRWADNDIYGHINNVAYYSFFDSAVNKLLIDAGLLDPAKSDVIGLVVETGCSYFAPLSYPVDIEVGVGVARLGRSSVTYSVAVFASGEDSAAAQGRFTHVYVGSADRRPVALPDDLRSYLSRLEIRGESEGEG